MFLGPAGAQREENVSKKPSIVITENEQKPEAGAMITVGPEDLVPDTSGANEPEDALDAAIVITGEDMVEGDMRARFQTPLLRQFVTFVSAGLPDVFLRAHPELSATAAANRSHRSLTDCPIRHSRNIWRPVWKPSSTSGEHQKGSHNGQANAKEHEGLHDRAGTASEGRH